MALTIGDTVATRQGKIGKLLGILSGVAHIGLPEKRIITAQVSDLKKVPDNIPEPPKSAVELSDEAKPEDDLVIIHIEPASSTQPSAEKAVAADPSLAVAIEVAPEAITKEWLSSVTLDHLKLLLEKDKTLTSPRRSKIRKEIKSRETTNAQ